MKISLIFLITILIIGCSDRQRNNYENKNDIIEDNAIQRWWIPSIIPNSSYEIVEEHNLDTNILKGSFRYDEKDEKNFLNKLTKLDQKLVWKGFVFIVNTENNQVEFSNK